MELQDLVPTRSKFTLKTTGKDYWLRPFNLEDEAWFRLEFGGNKVDKLVTKDTLDIVQLARVAFNQLEDKTAFRKQEIKIIDEEGNEKTVMLGGVKLLRTMMVGGEDKMSVLEAITECMTGNRPTAPILDDSEVKKKAP